ncbi:adenosine deaminase [Hyaloraphidium curvatum]|nr:adenosine deaminase [Hyaloraphidium curvatum]
MPISDYILSVPKVELHVHLEGSMPPETMLALAARHGIQLPADDVPGLRKWLDFRDMPHFVAIYFTISKCLQTPDDIELLGRDFLKQQARQNIWYSEVTFTPYTHWHQKRIPFAEQLEALNRARRWAETELGVTMRFIFDISREVSPDKGLWTADAVVRHFRDPDSGIVALGLGGYEPAHPAHKFGEAFARAQAAGVPIVLHAGEHGGPESIRAALALGSLRIGHGVRAAEDEELVAELVRRRVPLEISPTSNIRLKVVGSLQEHPVQKLIEAGVAVTINSDDAAMFNTSLTQEFLQCAEAFGWDMDQVDALILNAAQAVLLPPDERDALVSRIRSGLRQRDPQDWDQAGTVVRKTGHKPADEVTGTGAASVPA